MLVPAKRTHPRVQGQVLSVQGRHNAHSSSQPVRGPFSQRQSRADTLTRALMSAPRRGTPARPGARCQAPFAVLRWSRRASRTCESNPSPPAARSRDLKKGQGGTTSLGRRAATASEKRVEPSGYDASQMAIEQQTATLNAVLSLIMVRTTKRVVMANTTRTTNDGRRTTDDDEEDDAIIK